MRRPLFAWTLTVVAAVTLGQRTLTAQDFARAKATLTSCTDGSVVGSATLIEPPSSEGVKDVTIYCRCVTCRPASTLSTSTKSPRARRAPRPSATSISARSATTYR